MDGHHSSQAAGNKSPDDTEAFIDFNDTNDTTGTHETDDTNERANQEHQAQGKLGQQ